jgi:hypothetical protein
VAHPQTRAAKLHLPTQPIGLEITSPQSDSSGVGTGADNTNSPLLAFEQVSGSTEIGCYSHEGFFNTTEQTENHQSTSNEVSISSALIMRIMWVHCGFPLLINFPLSSEPTSNR